MRSLDEIGSGITEGELRFLRQALKEHRANVERVSVEDAANVRLAKANEKLKRVLTEVSDIPGLSVKIYKDAE